MNAHRIILAAFSQYFKSMFSQGTSESLETEVHLKFIDDPELMKIVLRYIYSGYADLTKANVHKILILANFLSSSDLVWECSCLIRKFINVKNCVKILLFAYQNNLQLLQEWCGAYVVENLEKVSDTNMDFGDLPVDVLLHLIKRPAAVVIEKPAENEKKLFMLVWNRIRHSAEEQKNYMKALLEAVHLPQLDAETLAYVETNVSPLSDVTELIQNAKAAKTGGSTKEDREWYLPRYKSKGVVKITENAADPLIVDDAEFRYYSQCILIRGFPWYVYAEKKDEKSVVHLGSPVDVEKHGLPYKVIAEATHKAKKGAENLEIGPNTYYMNVAEKKPSVQTVYNLENLKITISVKFEGASD